jgi:hypothetical protein
MRNGLDFRARMTNDDHLPGVKSMAQGSEMGPKNERADDRSDQRGDQHRAGGDVFCPAGEGMMIGRNQVHHAFDGGIQPFRSPDETDGSGDCAPFQPRDSKEKSRGDHRDRGREMNARVRLRAQKRGDPAKRKAKTRGQTPALFLPGHPVIAHRKEELFLIREKLRRLARGGRRSRLRCFAWGRFRRRLRFRLHLGVRFTGVFLLGRQFGSRVHFTGV